MNSRIVIVGADGQLANALASSAPGGYELIRASRGVLDIGEAEAVAQFLEAHRPTWVFNGAAFNAVDRAQGEGAPDAMRINASGVLNLAQGCEKVGARLLHFSTDFVFDGEKQTPYLESDATRPLSIYGASKLCGENLCLSVSERNLAIRVCRLFGPIAQNRGGTQSKPGGNFPLTMLQLARKYGKVRVVDDQIGAPTYTPDLARAVWQLVQNETSGLFHLCNAGEVSFADYAREIFEVAGVNCEIERVSSAQFNAPAPRPLYSTLSNARAHAAGVTPLRHYREALEEFLSKKASE